MTTQQSPRHGAPCWIDTWQPDLRAAARFYGSLLGWSFDDPPAVVSETGGEYLTARLDGRRVAGIGQSTAPGPAVWSTNVLVADLTVAVDRVVAGGGARIIGPVTIGHEGRLAIVTDPTGIPFGLWEAGLRTGAAAAGRAGTWAMSSLHTPDPERAAAFYGDLFGWELRQLDGAPFAQWRLGEESVAVLSATGGTAVPPHWGVNLAVADVDAVAAMAPTLGGTVAMAPFDAMGMRNGVIADPQGAVIALSSPAR